MGRKYGLSLQKMTEVINKSSNRSVTTENMLAKMVEGKLSSNFAMALSLKDVSLATKLGLNCGAPMMLATVTRGLLKAGVYEFGEQATMDETATLFETMANTKIAD